jgi:hypothetical protein
MWNRFSLPKIGSIAIVPVPAEAGPTKPRITKNIIKQDQDVIWDFKYGWVTSLHSKALKIPQHILINKGRKGKSLKKEIDNMHNKIRCQISFSIQVHQMCETFWWNVMDKMNNDSTIASRGMKCDQINEINLVDGIFTNMKLNYVWIRWIMFMKEINDASHQAYE